MFHLLKRKFDSEITTRDNDAIGLFDDLVDILAATEILDFRNDRNPFPSQKIPNSPDVVGVVNNNVGVKRFLHSGHSVDDEFMEGTVTPGHLISPEGGNDHKIAMTSELQLSSPRDLRVATLKPPGG